MALRRWVSGFAVLAAVAATSVPAAPANHGQFKTPSGNIVCEYFLDWPLRNGRRTAIIRCGIHSGLKPAPRRRDCKEGGFISDRVEMIATGRVYVPTCAGDPGPFVGEERARVLGYGKTWSGAGLRCTSEVAGVTCRNKSGHGWFLSRARWRSF